MDTLFTVYSQCTKQGLAQNRCLCGEGISNVERQRPLADSRLTSLTDITRNIFPRGLLDERERVWVFFFSFEFPRHQQSESLASVFSSLA